MVRYLSTYSALGTHSTVDRQTRQTRQTVRYAVWGPDPRFGRFKSRSACRSLPKSGRLLQATPPAQPHVPRRVPQHQCLGHEIPPTAKAGIKAGVPTPKPSRAMTTCYRGMEARFQGSWCWPVEISIGSATLGLAQLRGPQCPNVPIPQCAQCPRQGLPTLSSMPCPPAYPRSWQPTHSPAPAHAHADKPSADRLITTARTVSRCQSVLQRPAVPGLCFLPSCSLGWAPLVPS